MKKRWINRILMAGVAAMIAFISICNYSLPVFATEMEDTHEAQADKAEGGIPAITSIVPLSEAEAEISFDDKPSLADVNALLPEELSVFLDGADEATALSVTWECSDDYEGTEFDVYEFAPVWDTDAYPLASSFDAFTDMPYITVYVLQGAASVRLVDGKEAQASLDSLVKDKDVYALLYLCDTYEIKQQPGKKADTVATISTGQSVRITGVGKDSMCNIWYQVSTDIGGSTYNGYMERDYLAYSDEDLLAWEERCISSRTYRMAAPAALEISADIAQFPSSYQSGLLDLKEAHPNWIFVRMDTGLDWNTAVLEENKEARSLITSTANSSWKKSSFDPSWSYPTDEILAYYMDPRNFLTENHIFQFELLSYNKTYHTENAVAGILNGTFMSGAIPGDSKGLSYAQAFCAIAKQLDVSPFHLASRVRQEQGDGTSPLISGTHPSYPGVYNYFNIGAFGQGSAQVIENGLKKASEYKWTTRYLSLEGGSNIISKEYIRKGQNTLYLQKFNVSKTSPSGLYRHQYMQNIAAPSSEAVSVKKAYAAAGSIHNPFVFRIPVYHNMPSSACAQPTATSPAYTLPVLEAITYSPDLTLAKIPLPDGWTWDNPSIVPTVSNMGYPATYTSLSDTGKDTAVKKTIALTVNKGTPVYTIPSGLQTATGNTLSSIKLPVGFSWEDPSVILQKEGTVSYNASYNPDTANYQTITGIAIPITVTKKADAECTAHHYGEWAVSAPASCTAAGTQTRSCLLCGAKESKTIPALGHSYSSSIARQASCTEKGLKTYACSCGDTYSEEIPAFGHDMADNKCRRCGYTDSKNSSDSGQTNASSSSSGSNSGDGNNSSSNGSSGSVNSGNSSDNGNNSANSGNASGSGDSSANNNSSSGNSSSSANSNGSSSNGNGSVNTSNNSGNDSSSANNNNLSGNGNSSANSSNSSNGSNSANNNNASDSGDSSANSNSFSDNGNGSVNTSNNSGNGSSSANNNTSNNSKATASATDNTANAVTIDMKNTTVLYEESLSTIRGQDIDVILTMGNSISWTINGSSIVADEANGIDMGITVNAGNIPEAVLNQASALSKTGIIIEFSLAHDGPLDFHPILTINTAPENAGLIANLYYYNPSYGQLEFMDETEIAENGDIRFTFSHASDYVVIISETVMTDTETITSADTAENEAQPETSLDEPLGTEPNGQSASALKPSTIFIFVLIILVLIAIACTAFYMFRSKEDEKEEGDFEDENDFVEENLNTIPDKNEFFTEDLDAVPDEEEFSMEDLNAIPSENEFFIKDLNTVSGKDEFFMEDLTLLPSEKYSDDSPLDDGDFDDYHEPEKRKPIGNRPKLERDEFDDDEFDGFE